MRHHYANQQVVDYLSEHLIKQVVSMLIHGFLWTNHYLMIQLYSDSQYVLQWLISIYYIVLITVIQELLIND